MARTYRLLDAKSRQTIRKYDIPFHQRYDNMPLVKARARAHRDGQKMMGGVPHWYRRMCGSKRMRHDWQKQRHLHLRGRDWDGFSQRPWARDAAWYW